MQITPSLIVWIQGELQRRKLSYLQLSKLAGTSRQNIQRIATNSIAEITAKMESALCRGFGITIDELRLIAEGKTPIRPPCYDDECEKARAIWRWLQYDTRRIDTMRLLGYDGVLPEPYLDKPPKTVQTPTK